MSTDASIRAADTRAEARALSAAATTAGHAPSIHNTQPRRQRYATCKPSPHGTPTVGPS